MALATVLSHFQQPLVKVPDNPENTLLQDCIALYEPEMLRKVFGSKMYEDYVTGCNENTTKWVTLRDGATYVDTLEIERKWAGFTTAGSNPIACYVYYRYLEEVRALATDAGVKAQNTENMAPGNTAFRQVKAWNAMVEMLWELHGYLYANQALFPDYIGLTYPPDKLLRRGILENQNFFIPQNTYGF